MSLALIDLRKMFQFHNGSIKGSSLSPGPLPTPEFQFHNGSIKGTIEEASAAALALFQFHNGSIKGQSSL